jgi:hypothetical protein
LSPFELVDATPIEWTGPYDFGLPVKGISLSLIIKNIHLCDNDFHFQDYSRGQLAIVDGVVIPNSLSELLLKFVLSHNLNFEKHEN